MSLWNRDGKASSGELRVSVSGIRGIVGASMTPEVALKFSASFGNILGGGKVVVGRDTRPSGEGIKAAVVSGLIATGCSVVDVGIAPTPTVLFIRKELGAAGAVVVTASHNPGEWNALKLAGPDGNFIHGDLSRRLLETYESGEIKWNTCGELGVYSSMDGIGPHVEAILSLPILNTEKIKNRGLRVILDCVNGAGSDAAQALLARLGCDVIPVNCEKTGIFTRDPEPVAAHLGELEARVKERKADIGFALDPDADRLSVVDEKGRAAGEELTLPLVVDLILRHEKGPIVINLSTSMIAEDIAEAHGVPSYRTPVGEVNVALLMREKSAVIGGEGNGGIMYPGLHIARDGICGMALILQYILERGESVSEIVSGYPSYHMIKKKIGIGARKAADVLDKLEVEAFGEVNREDGLRITGDGAWVHLRPSNTEPVMRIIAEAKSGDEAKKLAAFFEEKIIELL